MSSTKFLEFGALNQGTRMRVWGLRVRSNFVPLLQLSHTQTEALVRYELLKAEDMGSGLSFQ